MSYQVVHTTSERFKQGWVAGLYDALSDDGLHYLDDILRYGLRTRDDADFMAGYRSGQRARRGSRTGSDDPRDTDLRTAA